MTNILGPIGTKLIMLDKSGEEVGRTEITAIIGRFAHTKSISGGSVRRPSFNITNGKCSTHKTIDRASPIGPGDLQEKT